MARKAFVVIDIQNGFINKNTQHVPARVRDYLKQHKSEYEVVIATRYINTPNTSCYKIEGWKGCMQGTDEIEIVDELTGLYDYVVDKNRYACTNFEFVKILHDYKIDEIYMCGLNTECCVLSSAFILYDNGFPIYVFDELSGSTSGQAAHEAGLLTFKRCMTKNSVLHAAI